jgi:oxygen-dependent protoporphyrinogen oxidase
MGARVIGVEASSTGGSFRVRLADGDTLRADAVIVACPGAPAATALQGLDAPLAVELSRLRYASCATVNIAYRADDVAGRLSGFGFFVPRTEGLPILACSYLSEKFPGRAPGGVAVFRVFLGGATRPEIMDASDPELVRQTDETLRRILAIRGEPLIAKAYRAERAMPQFDVGAQASIAALRARAARHPGLILAGSVVGAFGLPDCIRSGEEAAASAEAFLSTRQGAPAGVVSAVS